MKISHCASWFAHSVLLGLVLLVSGCASPVWRGGNGPSAKPPAPGFHLEEFPEAGIKVWCPDGWYRGESRAKGAFTGSLSVEDFQKDKFFVTGFTVQAIHNLSERSRILPSTFAESMAREIRESGFNTVLDWKPFVSADRSGFRSASVRYRNAPPGGRKITVQKFIVAMNEVDRLVIVTFESPDESWERYFASAGRLMLENLMFVLPGIAK